jgi:CRP-like cAMP-binding protein
VSKRTAALSLSLMPQDVLVRVATPVAVPPGRAADSALGRATRPGRSYRPNAEIFGDGKPAEYLYCVVTGSVRTIKVFTDGRRQVSGFYLPGDIFGLEFAETYSCSAEAITDTRLRAIGRRTLGMRAERDCTIAGELLALTGWELKRAQYRALLLGKIAQERVASFLVEMPEKERVATRSTCLCRAKTSPTTSV